MNKRLNTNKPGMKWEWFFRIIDASYRVHTRLYKLHYAIVHTEATIFALLKNIIITSNAIIISAIFGLTFFYMQITDLKLSPGSGLTLFLVISLLLSIYGYQFHQAKKIEKQLLEMSKEIKGETLETWPGYLWDEAAKWGTRILMLKEILKEYENIQPDKQDPSYIISKKNFTRHVGYSIGKLEEIKTECEVNLSNPENKDYDKTIRICNEFIEIGKSI